MVSRFHDQNYGLNNADTEQGSRFKRSEEVDQVKIVQTAWLDLFTVMQRFRLKTLGS